MKHVLHQTDAFHQLAVNTLLDLCTNQVNNESIIKLQGRLILTVTSGDIFELVINEDSDSDELVPSNSTIHSPLGSCIAEQDHLSDNPDGVNISTEHVIDPSCSMLYGTTDDSLGQTLVGGLLSATDEFYLCQDCGAAFKNVQTMNHHICDAKQVDRGSTSDVVTCQDMMSTSALNFVIKTEANKDDYIIMKVQQERNWSCGGSKQNKRQKFVKRPKCNSDGLIKCSECDKSFTSRSVQTMHRINEHRTHSCARCNKLFVGRKQFAEHVHSTHPGVPLYQVNNQYVCEYCSAFCADESRLSDHIATRHLGFVHRCPVCHKCLGSAETLRIHHRQVHDTESRRTCEACGRQFSRLIGLLEHLRAAHPDMIPDEYQRKLREFVCTSCGLTFSRRGTLRRHVETKHSGEPKYSCSQCGRKFQCRRYLVRHQRSSHHAVVKLEDDTKSSSLQQQPGGTDTVVIVDLMTL
jgi:uncharacterized C2H2 Zn-finger protein